MPNQDKNISTFPQAIVDGYAMGVSGGSAKTFYTRPWSAGRWRGVKVITGTSYTLAIDDEGQLLQFTNSGAISVTLPTQVAVDFPVGGGVTMLRTGTGQITVMAASGVTLTAAGRPKFRVTGSVAEVRKFATNEWLMWGDTLA